MQNPLRLLSAHLYRSLAQANGLNSRIGLA